MRLPRWRRRPAPTDGLADKVQTLRDREGEALPPAPARPVDPYFCLVCRRGASGAWCAWCGTGTRAIDLGAWNRDPFETRTS